MCISMDATASVLFSFKSIVLASSDEVYACKRLIANPCLTVTGVCCDGSGAQLSRLGPALRLIRAQVSRSLLLSATASPDQHVHHEQRSPAQNGRA